jgi:hypothetical protein
MKGSVTARYALRHGLPRNAQTTSPYSHNNGHAAWLSVVDVRACGSTHVELLNDKGRWFMVDMTHPIFSVKA